MHMRPPFILAKNAQLKILILAVPTFVGDLSLLHHFQSDISDIVQLHQEYRPAWGGKPKVKI